MFQGSMVAIVTPMNSDGSLDIKSFKGLLDYHIECKSDGVVVVGTSGEAPTIDVDEHTYLIKEACLSILKQLMTVWISLKFFTMCHVEPVLISITKQSKI